MTVTVLELPDRRVELIGHGQPGEGPATSHAVVGPVSDAMHAVALVLAGGALCSDAVLEPGSGAPFQVIGDPTEGALVIAAARFGLAKSALEARRMATVHAVDAAPAAAQGQDAADRSTDWLEVLQRAFPELRAVVFTKGAVDGLLTVCSHAWVEGRPVPLDATWRARLGQAHDR
ncbi:MAG: ATPase, partial [Chloroflexota bacterium]